MSENYSISVTLSAVPGLYLKKILEHCQPLEDGNSLDRRFPSNGVSLVSIGKELGLGYPEIVLYALSQCGILKLVPMNSSQGINPIEIPLTYLPSIGEPAVFSLAQVNITVAEMGSFDLRDYFPGKYGIEYIKEKLPLIIRYLKDNMSKKEGGWFDPKGKLTICIHNNCGVSEAFAKFAIIYFRDMWVLEEDGRKLDRHHIRRFAPSIYSGENSTNNKPIEYFGNMNLAEILSEESIGKAYKAVRNKLEQAAEYRRQSAEFLRKADEVEAECPAIVDVALKVHQGNIARANLSKLLESKE